MPKLLSNKERTKRFNRLSPERKRVAIAKDVLKQLKRGVYIPERGKYIDGGMDVNQTNVCEAEQCTVCQAGGLLLSAVRLGNSVDEYMEDTDSDAVFRGLTKWFPARDIALVEYAFEVGRVELMMEEAGNAGVYVTSDERSAAKAFGCKYKTIRGRMRGICKNIIANKGTFKP